MAEGREGGEGVRELWISEKVLVCDLVKVEYGW